MRKIIFGLITAIILLVVTVSPVMATADITSVSASATKTTVTLRWTKIGTSTLVRYATNTFPATTATGTSAYSGADYFTTVTGLTSGTTYFFSIWAYDGANYSTNAYHIAVSTLYADIATGGEYNQRDIPPIPNLPADLVAAPNAGGLDLEPFTTILEAFNSAPGGLGMPVNNMYEGITYISITILAALIYKYSKSLLITWVLSLALSVAGYRMELCQIHGIIIIVVLGLGAWAAQSLMDRG